MARYTAISMPSLAAFAPGRAPGAGPPLAQGGYIAGKAEKLPDLEIGLGDSGLEEKGGDYEILTGKGYSLKIASTGKHECAIVAPQLFNNIYVRKVEINKVEVKLAGLIEIEMEEEGEAELYFVAIRPGQYKWGCRNLEEKGLSGTFTVK